LVEYKEATFQLYIHLQVYKQIKEKDLFKHQTLSEHISITLWDQWR